MAYRYFNPNPNFHNNGDCVIRAISKIMNQSWDSKDVELVDKFVDIIKDINEISMSSEMDGYSQMNGGSYNNGGYMRGRSGRMMYGGRSYGRGSSYVRGGNGYSRDDNRDAMLDHLQEVMDMAVDEKDRKAVSRLMDQMASQ